VSPGGSIDVRPIRSKSELKQFIKLPCSLYRDDPRWVPPLIVDRLAFLDFKKNPFYQTAEVSLWMAYRGGTPVGRISACVNADYNEFHGERTGHFGFYESIDDEQVAVTLYDTASEWLRARGMNRMWGPCSFSTNHEVGFLADGFDTPPMVMMPHTHPYYLSLAERCGMVKERDLWAFIKHEVDPIPDRIRRIANRVRERVGVTIRRINMKRFGEELEQVRKIYNEAWSKNWGFVPLREEEFQHIAKDMKLIIDPEIAFIAEIEGEAVGFCLSLPNIYESQIKLRSGRLLPFGWFRLLWDLKVAHNVASTRTLTMGVVHDHRNRGIEAVFYIESFDRGTARGYRKGEFSWVLEDNEMMIRAAHAMGAHRYKTYRVYGKDL